MMKRKSATMETSPNVLLQLPIDLLKTIAIFIDLTITDVCRTWSTISKYLAQKAFQI